MSVFNILVCSLELMLKLPKYIIITLDVLSLYTYYFLIIAIGYLFIFINT